MNFSCSNCGQEYVVETSEFRCECGGPFKLCWKPTPVPLGSLKERRTSIWRYRESLPITHDRSIVSLGEGFTPLLPFPYGDFKNINLKLDYLCPTGSYKDRGSSVLISKLKEMGIRELIEDSSGNAGSSIAAYAARAGIGCTIYCPVSTSEGKLVQIRSYGAQLVKVPGTRAETASAAQEASKRTYYASHNWNPFFLQGVKTLAFELFEQLGFQPPDAVLCPIGYGGIYLGLYYGFNELLEQGMIKKLPRLIGIQAEVVPPVYEAFHGNAEDVDEVPSGKTLAEGIACVRPVRGREILAIAQSTGGCIEIVSEQEILEGWKDLAQAGIYVEPTSAVVIKAVDRLIAKSFLNLDEIIVLILTGIGLKATETLGKYVT